MNDAPPQRATAATPPSGPVIRDNVVRLRPPCPIPPEPPAAAPPPRHQPSGDDDDPGPAAA